MEGQLPNPDNGGKQELEHPSNGDNPPPNFHDEIDSSCSTPYVSAPSSPGRVPTGYYFSAPASPMHFALASVDLEAESSPAFISTSTSEFEFSARFPSSSSASAGSMISADELFLNGQIRPMKLSSHLQRPQVLAPLLDLDIEEEEDKEANTRGREMNVKFRNRSVHRRARSLSPMRNFPQFKWHVEEDQQNAGGDAKDLDFKDQELLQKQEASLSPSSETTPSVSASSSRSSSSGRSSKRWVFLKDFLYRSKSEGRGNPKEKFWHSISFAPSKEKKPPSSSSSSSSSATASPSPASFLFHSSRQKKCCHIPVPAEAKKERKAGQAPAKKPTNGVGKRRVPPSPHELHYTTNRAQAEEMRKKTFLPYRQGLLGCLGFSSKGFGYGAMNGLAKTLNTVTSR